MSRKELSEACQAEADALSLRLYYLKSMTELVSFATEARRVLRSINEATLFSPEIEKHIRDHVEFFSHWEGMPDTASTVAEFIAEQMEEVNTGFTDAVYRASRRLEEDV